MLRVAPKSRDLWTDEEFIKAHGDEAKADRRSRPVFLGNLQRPGWSGPIPTYLIWCRECQYGEEGGFTVAHEAGYQRRLECKHCRTRYELNLPRRRAKDMVLNPHHYPYLIAFLILMAILTASFLR